MARIPLGNQGDVVASAPQQVQTNAGEFGAQSGQALSSLGATAQALGEQQMRQQAQLKDDLARTNAAVAYQTHATQVQTALKDNDTKLSTGQIDQVEYEANVNSAKQDSYDQTIGQLPQNHYKDVATIQTAGLDKQVALASQATITKNTQQQIAANADTMLDTASKSIIANPASIDQTVDGVKSSFVQTAQAAGIPLAQAQQKAQTWAESQYTGHAQSTLIAARSAGDVDALNKLESDLTDNKGFYAGKLDANQRNQLWAQTVSARQGLESQQNAEQNAKEAQAKTVYNQYLDLTQQGKQPSPEFMNQLVTQTAGTTLGVPAQDLIKQSAQTTAFAKLSVPGMRAAIQKDQGDANNPAVGTDPATMAAVKARQTMLDAAVSAYQKDPWNAALDRGVIPSIPPIDTSSIAGSLQGIQARAQMVGTIENQAGRRVSLLTPEESKSVLTQVQSLGPDARSQVLQQLGNTFNNAGRVGDLAEQWASAGDKPTALALKAGVGGGTGDPLLTDKGMPISSFILEGAQALKDKTVKIDDTAVNGIQAKIANQINGTMPPQAQEDAKESAYYIAIGNAHRNGREQITDDDINAGVATATGGISNTGGVKLSGQPQQVARPFGWTDDQYQGAVKTAGPANIENQIGGKPIDTVYAGDKAIPVTDFMAKFPSYQLTRVGVRGTYAVVAGSKFVTDKTGQPVTIHLNRQQAAQSSGAVSAPAPNSDVPPIL